MAVLKCKMCGGDLNISEEVSVCECEYCGSKQTVPSVDNEKKVSLFTRANRLRSLCEFDKACGVYESIVSEFPEEAEAYWGLVLCKYGIEYVDDPATGKKVPTCHRSSFDNVMEDSDFEMVMEYADILSRSLYREEAKVIEEIRSGIVEVSAKEEPYDIFICYKETDENGERTLDSVLAQDVYDALTEKGYRVFFSRISLESKLGVEYEPYIFAALNSAKLMLVFGTSYDYFNAVWVKNEWSRYLMLMSKDKSKYLIPCFKNVDAYDIPKEFSKLQSQDMGKLGAIQDLLRGIDKLIGKKEEKTITQVVEPMGYAGGSINSLIKRGFMSLEDGEWDTANDFFENALNFNAELGVAYFGKLLAQYECCNIDGLANKLTDRIMEQIQEEWVYVDAPDWVKDAEQEYSFLLFLEPEVCQTYINPFGYKSTLSSTKDTLDKSSAQSLLDNEKLFQRASQYADATLSDTIKKLNMMLEEKKAVIMEKAIEKDEEHKKSINMETAGYFDDLKKTLDEIKEPLNKYIDQDTESLRVRHNEWEKQKAEFEQKHFEWEENLKKYKEKIKVYQDQYDKALKYYDKVVADVKDQRTKIQSQIDSLEIEKNGLEGLFVQKREKILTSNILELKNRLKELSFPIRPTKDNFPKEPIEPIIGEEPKRDLEAIRELIMRSMEKANVPKRPING